MMMVEKNKNLPIFITLLIGIFFLFSQASYPAFALEIDTENLETIADDAIETSSELATIYVIRIKAFKGSMIKKKIYFNYNYMGKIANETYAVYQVPPGEYLLGVLDDKDKRSITLNVEAGKTYYARLVMRMGIAKARGQFFHLDEKEAKGYLPFLNPADDENIIPYPTN